MAQKNYPFAVLALLDWLTEGRQGDRVLNTSRHSSYYFEAVAGERGKKRLTRVYPGHSRDDKAAELAFLERLGGRSEIDTLRIFRDGLLLSFHPLGHGIDRNKGKIRYEDFISRYESDPFHYSSNIYLPSRKAFEFMAGPGREMFEQAKAKRQAERDAVSRLVIVGQNVVVRPFLPKEVHDRIPEGFALPNPGHRVVRPYALARVVKETPQRLYLQDIEVARLARADVRYNEPISGYEPNKYISHDQVLVDNATPELLERLVAIDAEHIADLERLTLEWVEHYIPIASSMSGRLVQKDAEREGRLHEAISEFLSNTGQSPSPSRKP